MVMSVYPNGFSYGVSIRGVPVNTMYSGNTYWVDSARGSNGNRGTREKPFATLDYAIGRCSANSGDVIFVRENHAETITGAGGIACDVAGITIVGLGTFNQRPRFLMDGATTVSLTITAEDVTLQNLVFASGHADVVTCIDITAKGANILACEFVDNVTDENFLTPIKCTSTSNNNADGLRVIGCRNVTPDAATLEFLEINANLDGLIALNNVHYAKGGTASPFILSAGTKNLTNADIGWNRVQNANTANDVFLDNGGSGNSGLCYNNYVGNLDVTGAQILGAATGIQFFENYLTSTSTESGAVAPTADTPNS